MKPIKRYILFRWFVVIPLMLVPVAASFVTELLENVFKVLNKFMLRACVDPALKALAAVESRIREEDTCRKLKWSLKNIKLSEADRRRFERIVEQHETRRNLQ